MCVFVSRPMKIVTFLLKNDYTPKRVVDFPWERDTFRNKIMEIVDDFDERSYNNNGKTLEIVEDFECESIFFHFSFYFHHFSPFFRFFFIFSFSFIFLHFLSFSFIFFHFLLSSFIFFYFLSFSFIFFHFVGC